MTWLHKQFKESLDVTSQHALGTGMLDERSFKVIIIVCTSQEDGTGSHHDPHSCTSHRVSFPMYTNSSKRA